MSRPSARIASNVTSARCGRWGISGPSSHRLIIPGLQRALGRKDTLEGLEEIGDRKRYGRQTF